jgi:hypothetical protein
MRATVLATAIVVIAAIGRPAAADDDPAVAGVLAAWQDGNTAEVIARADRALAVTALAPADRITILELRGAALAVDGRPGDATAAFKQVFALDPDAELASYLRSPSLRAMFEAARGAWRAETETFMREHHAGEIEQIRVDLKPPAVPRGGQTLVFEIALKDPGNLGRRILFSYKRRNSTDYTTLAERASAHLRFSIPEQLTESRARYVLDYHLVLRADNGYDLAALGDLQKPRSLEVAAGLRPGPPAPVYRRWWFWTGIGAASGLIGFVIYRARDVGPQRGVSFPIGH